MKVKNQEKGKKMNWNIDTSLKTLFVKKEDAHVLKSNDSETYDRIEDVEVFFKCCGGPIGEIGTFSGKVTFTIYYVRSNHSTIKQDGKIHKSLQHIQLNSEDIQKILSLFKEEDFNPDDAFDLTISEPDCNGEWSSI